MAETGNHVADPDDDVFDTNEAHRHHVWPELMSCDCIRILYEYCPVLLRLRLFFLLFLLLLPVSPSTHMVAQKRANLHGLFCELKWKWKIQDEREDGVSIFHQLQRDLSSPPVPLSDETVVGVASRVSPGPAHLVTSSNSCSENVDDALLARAALSPLAQLLWPARRGYTASQTVDSGTHSLTHSRSHTCL
ncbi:hypothetical protein PoB_005977500 [Plakobranchus ocellatus]|uniref:Uncharacterized protein n=1 Tax=Plakobranchus ocellatus TaxID=259542 RepID=A0AAV4CMV4_9GAST|nr:hypothetical protein PoB_005977500 [Plakobranchus ocellatus]